MQRRVVQYSTQAGTELLQQTHDIRFVEVVGEQIQRDFGIGQALLEESEHHLACMIAKPGVLSPERGGIVVERLGAVRLDGSVLELIDIGLRREIAAGKSHLKALELWL